MPADPAQQPRALELFSRDEATLYEVMSDGPMVHWSVTSYFFGRVYGLVLKSFIQLKELVSDLCLPKTDCNNYMSGEESVAYFDFVERNTIHQVAMICLAIGYNIIALTILTLKMWCKRR